MSKEFPWPQIDPETGLKYLVETPGGAKLYKHPPCEICGMDCWSYSKYDARHGSCHKPSHNDNVHPVDQDGHGRFIP